MDKGRFEAFSDGVFAFAITLLVLGFALPAMEHPSEAQLRHELFRLWPNLIAYGLSFGVIGIMWQNHHALFRLVRRIDRVTVLLNLVLMSGTVLIPFATSTLGSYPTIHSSTLLYGIVLSYCACSYTVLLLHLARRKAFAGSLSPQVLQATTRAYLIGNATYIGATLVALVSPVVSFALYIAIAIYFLIPRGVDADLPESEA